MKTELSAAMYVCDPTQTKFAVFNNPADPNFVGYITDITGFDSPDVRENAENINAGDGGYHGNFYHGRRPWTVSGTIQPSTPAVARSAAQTKIDIVMNACTKQDGYLVYGTSDGITRYLRFRKQQPQRITTNAGPAKDFQIAGVCRDWRFLTSGAPNSHNIGVNQIVSGIFGNGDAVAPMAITINGPADTPAIGISGIGPIVNFPNMPNGTIPAGYSCTIDLTGQYPSAIRSDGYDLYGYIDALTSWKTLGVQPGTQSWYSTASNTNGNSSVTLSWNDAWN